MHLWNKGKSREGDGTEGKLRGNEKERREGLCWVKGQKESKDVNRVGDSS